QAVHVTQSCHETEEDEHGQASGFAVILADPIQNFLKAHTVKYLRNSSARWLLENLFNLQALLGQDKPLLTRLLVVLPDRAAACFFISLYSASLIRSASSFR